MDTAPFAVVVFLHQPRLALSYNSPGVQLEGVAETKDGAASLARCENAPSIGSLIKTSLTQNYSDPLTGVSHVRAWHQIMPNTIAARNTNDIIVASTFNLVLISIVAS